MKSSGDSLPSKQTGSEKFGSHFGLKVVAFATIFMTDHYFYDSKEQHPPPVVLEFGCNGPGGVLTTYSHGRDPRESRQMNSGPNNNGEGHSCLKGHRKGFKLKFKGSEIKALEKFGNRKGLFLCQSWFFRPQVTSP